tara:strand:+ start:35 stop:1402 length:1368 start_codon:yes stop_codon:yes gene_type:complete
MTAINSRPRVINGKTYSISIVDGKLMGAYEQTVNGLYKPVDNNTSEFNIISSSSETLDAYNKAVYGSNKESYKQNISDIEVADFGEQSQFFNEQNKKFNNAQYIETTTDKDGVATTTTKTGGYAPTASKGQSQILSYPFGFDINQDHLKITKYEYRRPDINMSKSGNVAMNIYTGSGPGSGDKGLNKDKITTRTTGDSVLGELLGSIFLPMPKVADVNGVEWGNSELTISGLMGLGAAEKLIAGTGGSGKDSTDIQKDKDALESLRESLDGQGGRNVAGSSNTELIRALKVKTLSGLAGGLTGSNLDADTYLARTSGRVLNPNAEVLFQGPVIRDFSFSFVMIARSQREGAEIRKIIRFLKLGMAPKFRSTTFLKNPDVFMLEYRSGNSVLNTVNRFNPGGLALKTMSVDYAPNGYWSAYKDSQPVALKMDLSFTELRPVYEGDQQLTPEDSVGL